MALVAVTIVNNSGQTVSRMVDDGEDLEYLKRLVRREDIQSLEVEAESKPAARKPAAK